MSLEAAAPRLRRAPRLRWPQLLSTWPGRIGVAMIFFVLAVTLLGPLVAPHPLDAPIGVPGSEPSGDAPLGTDYLGRDVLSRVLHGGGSVVLVAVLTTALVCLVGTTIGLVAGFSRGFADPALMRSVDLVMAFPPLLFLLVLITGVGTSNLVVVLGTTVVLSAPLARLVRTATLEVRETYFVEAAIIRGERRSAILAREILPNISPYVIATLGPFLSVTIILTASLSFLGLGAQPPAANWGLMIAENQQVISTNIWAVLAPAIMVGMIAVGASLIGDAYSRSLGHSRSSR